MPSLADRALSVFPAGISNGEFGFPKGDLVVMERGEGARLWDLDGREFLDFSIGWGSVLVGHARPEVVAAVMAQAPNGSNFAYLNAKALAVAEEIVRLSPASDLVRFCASGTEATMYCMRLAKAHTGKRKIMKFEGAYHGANMAGVTSLFPHLLKNFPEPELTSAGTPEALDDLLVAPFNDLEAARSIMSENRDALAGVIVEPLQRCTPPEPGFLEGLREACTELDIALIFDEVVTGFRLAYGGAQAYYGVTPDLVAYGKALGGGYPIGAFGGKAEIMEQVNEDRIGQSDYVWMASTLGGNPISMAAADATLSVLRGDGVFEGLHTLGRYFRDRLRRVLNDYGIEAQVIGDGPLAQLIFATHPIRDYRSTFKSDKALAQAVMMGLFRERVFLNPMGTKLYLSLAHDEAICDEFCARLGTVLDTVRGGK